MDGLLTAETARELLDYDPETGLFTWKERPLKYFRTEGYQRRWNDRYVGQPAFTTKTTGGYLQGYIFDKKWFAHRVAWLITHGDWPTHEIDHRDRDPSNNKLKNLRDVFASVNVINRGMNKNNTTGVVGVYRKRKKYMASIYRNGATHRTGPFETLQEAANARKELEDRMAV